MPKKDPPKADVIAFRKAQALATLSPIARFEVSALDCGEDWEGFYDHLAQVRRAHLTALLAEGCTYENDPDGEKLDTRIFAGDKTDENHDAYLAQLMHREEAGFFYGLAIGLLLGRGGVR